MVRQCSLRQCSSCITLCLASCWFFVWSPSQKPQAIFLPCVQLSWWMYTYLYYSFLPHLPYMLSPSFCVCDGVGDFNLVLYLLSGVLGAEKRKVRSEVAVSSVKVWLDDFDSLSWFAFVNRLLGFLMRMNSYLCISRSRLDW